MILSDLLNHIENVEIELDKDLSKFSTMRLRAKGDLITVTSLESLQKIVKTLNKAEQDFSVLGLGANQLLKVDSKIPYLMIKLPFDKSYLDEIRDEYILPASVKLSVLTSHASKFGLKNWEVITGIPATLGGALFMNAGTGLGEIQEIVSTVGIVNRDGELKTHEVKAGSFSYRKNNFLLPGEVIYEATLKNFGQDEKITEVIKNYLRKRNETQPMKELTCGCMFKNSSFLEAPCPAGKFIDIIGLKGFQNNGIRISSKHGNFMENFDGATYEDVKKLVEAVQFEMKLQYGINFELEVKAEK